MANLYFAQAGDISLSRRAAKGELFRIRNGIYVDSFDLSEQQRALNTGWMEVASFLFPKAVLVDRTAAELLPKNGRIYLVSAAIRKRRVVQVGDLSFDISGGNVLTGVEQITPDLMRSQQARYCLENLAFSRQRNGVKRTLGVVWLESELIKVLRLRGEIGLNAIRDEARALASTLNLQQEFEHFTVLVSALLKTHTSKGILQSGAGIAQAQGSPFDVQRINLFQQLSNYLLKLDLAPINFSYEQAAWRHLTFFDSYFSNYIEGTQFTLEEAEVIVFERKPNYQRHADSHDVLSHVDLSGDMSEMCRVPETAEEFIDILKTRHLLLMAERQDKRPGLFKEKANKAGSSLFVVPDLVEGTLVEGFQLYKDLPEGLLRALFMHFLVSECHPFDDGNGRLARIMMNAELVVLGQQKIIVPIVHRESYLNGLRMASRELNFRTMVKVLHQMQCYCALLDWGDYAEVKASLQLHGADKDPNEGVVIFNKVIARLGGAYPVV
jgi:hypothetical protein